MMMLVMIVVIIATITTFTALIIVIFSLVHVTDRGGGVEEYVIHHDIDLIIVITVM